MGCNSSLAYLRHLGLRATDPCCPGGLVLVPVRVVAGHPHHHPAMVHHAVGAAAEQAQAGVCHQQLGWRVELPVVSGPVCHEGQAEELSG